jgi:MFS family permease
VWSFATHGALSGTLGPRIPDLKARAGASAGDLGIALMGLAAGLFAGTRLAGPPLHRFGSRPVIRAGLPVMGAALVLIGTARSVPVLALAFAGLGFCGGLLDVAMNTSAVAVERGYGRPLMSSIHATWSVGMLVGSALGTGAAALGVSPWLHFAVVAAALALSTAWTQAGLLGADEERMPVQEEGFDTSITASDLATPVAVLLLGLVAFGSFLAEGASADWSAVYLRDGLGASAGVAGAAFVAYSAGMTLSRFVADRLTGRLGPVAVVRAAGIGAAVALAGGLAVHRPVAAIAMFAVVGAALGPVVPITFSAAGNTPVGARSSALGWAVTLGYLGTTVGPVAIGFTAQLLDLRVALLIPAALGLVVAALADRVRAAAGGSTPPAPASY